MDQRPFSCIPVPRKLKGWWQKFQLCSKKRKAGASPGASQGPWEADYELVPCEGLFDEYLEMGRSPLAAAAVAGAVGRDGQPFCSGTSQPDIPLSTSALKCAVVVGWGQRVGPVENPEKNSFPLRVPRRVG